MAEEVELAFGGVAPKAIMAPKTETALVGKPWDEALLSSALDTLAEDVNITPNAPGVHSRPAIYPCTHSCCLSALEASCQNGYGAAYC